MKNSKKSGGRVASYAEAARVHCGASAPPEEFPIIQPVKSKTGPSQAPSASTARESTHRGDELSTRAASYNGPRQVPVSSLGLGPKPGQGIAEGKNSAGRAHVKDTLTQTQSQAQTQKVSTLSHELGIQTHRTFSYADAARGRKSKIAINPQASITNSPKPLMASSSESHAASTTTMATLPPDKQTNKVKEIEHAASPRPLTRPSNPIPPAVPAIDFRSMPRKNKNRNWKKNKDSSSGPSASQVPGVGSSSAPPQHPGGPNPPPTATSSVAAQPPVTSSTLGKGKGKGKGKGRDSTNSSTAQGTARSTSSPAKSTLATSAAQEKSVASSSRAAPQLPSSPTAEGSAPAASYKSKKKNKNKNKNKKQANSRHNSSSIVSQPSTTPSQTSRPPSQDLSQLLAQDPSLAWPDALVESTINEANKPIVDEKARQLEFQEREIRKLSVIAQHDNNEAAVSLWDSMLEWDVKIIGGRQENGESVRHEWRAHHDILCRESPYFRHHLPAKDTQGGFVELDCSSHNAEALATALRFMYKKTYEGGTIDFSSGAGKGNIVPDGEPIRKNMFMYICGASVECNSLMKLAVDRIDEITEAILDNNLFTREFCQTNNLSKFHHPLTVALRSLYDQGDRGHMWMMRLAMARLLDVILFKMLLNESFFKSVMQEWVPEHLWQNVMIDNQFFSDELFPMNGIDGEGKAKLISEVAKKLAQNPPSTDDSGQVSRRDSPGSSPPSKATPQVTSNSSESNPTLASQPAGGFRSRAQSTPVTYHPGQAPGIGVETALATRQPFRMAGVESNLTPASQSAQDIRGGGQSTPAGSYPGQAPTLGAHTTPATRQAPQVPQMSFPATSTTPPLRGTGFGAQLTPPAGYSGHAPGMGFHGAATSKPPPRFAEQRHRETPPTGHHVQARGLGLSYPPPIPLAAGFIVGVRIPLANSHSADMAAMHFGRAPEPDFHSAPPTHPTPGTRPRYYSTPIASSYPMLGPQPPPTTQLTQSIGQGFNGTPTSSQPGQAPRIRLPFTPPIHEAQAVRDYVPTSATTHQLLRTYRAAQNPAPVYTSQDPRAYQTPPREDQRRGEMATENTRFQSQRDISATPGRRSNPNSYTPEGPGLPGGLRGGGERVPAPRVNNRQEFPVTPERNRGPGGNFAGTPRHQHPGGHPVTPYTPGASLLPRGGLPGELACGRDLPPQECHTWRDGTPIRGGTLRFDTEGSPQRGTTNVPGLGRGRGNGTGHPHAGRATLSRGGVADAPNRGHMRQRRQTEQARPVTSGSGPGFHPQGTTAAAAAAPAVPPPAGTPSGTVSGPTNVMVQGNQTMGHPIEEASPRRQ